MAKSRDSYLISGNTLDELKRDLSFKLQRLADRVDKMEGIRGTASIESELVMNSNVISDVGTGAEDTDAARRADLPGSDAEFNSVTTDANVEVGGDIKVYDSDGNLIHSLE